MDVKPITRFYTEPVEQKGESQKQGRPIFKDVEFVEITMPGDSKSQLVREVRDIERERFSEAYRKFKEHQEATAVDGTPISQWGRLTPSRAMELKVQNILSVEHLAGLTDSQIQHIGMGGRELVAEAKAFIASATDNAAAQNFAAENAKLQEQIERNNQTIEQMAKQLAALESPEKRGPGRPRKEP